MRMLRFSRSARPLACASALVIGAALVHANADAELDYQLGNLLFDETRYHEALQAFDRAIAAEDEALSVRARKGKVRSALRVAQFTLARSEAEALREGTSGDAEALALY